MKAVVVHKYGGPEVLKFEDYPDPVPGAGEVLVRVAAASVNPLPWVAVPARTPRGGRRLPCGHPLWAFVGTPTRARAASKRVDAL